MPVRIERPFEMLRPAPGGTLSTAQCRVPAVSTTKASPASACGKIHGSFDEELASHHQSPLPRVCQQEAVLVRPVAALLARAALAGRWCSRGSGERPYGSGNHRPASVSVAVGGGEAALWKRRLAVLLQQRGEVSDRRSRRRASLQRQPQQVHPEKPAVEAASRVREMPCVQLRSPPRRPRLFPELVCEERGDGLIPADHATRVGTDLAPGTCKTGGDGVGRTQRTSAHQRSSPHIQAGLESTTACVRST